MTGKTHSMFGFVTAAATLASIQSMGVGVEAFWLLGFASAGAYKVDLDSHGNKAARKGFEPLYQLVSKTPILKTIFGHRGLLHSYVISTLLIYIGLLVFWDADVVSGGIVRGVAYSIIGYGVGYTSHVFLDSFNPVGVYALLPIPVRISLMAIPTGTVYELFFGSLFIGMMGLHSMLVYYGWVLN